MFCLGMHHLCSVPGVCVRLSLGASALSIGDIPQSKAVVSVRFSWGVVPPAVTELQPKELGFFRNKFIQHVHLIRLNYKPMPLLCKMIGRRMRLCLNEGNSGMLFLSVSFLPSTSIWTQQFNTFSAAGNAQGCLDQAVAPQGLLLWADQHKSSAMWEDPCSETSALPPTAGAWWV